MSGWRVAILSVIGTIAVQAQVRYTVRFSDPRSHYVEVEAVFPAAGKPTVEIFMPVWTPGSYLIREYQRNVENMRAFAAGGGELAVMKSHKNRWRVETGGASAVRFSYKVYCREMSVRTNWVEDSFALLNGAATYVAEPGELNRPHEITFELPSQWKITMTGLPDAPDGRPHHYVAPDYDTLVDSPVVAGNPAVYRFEVDGIPHFLVNQGEDGVWDGARAVADVEKIVRANRTMWGSLPYKKYVFLNMITEAGGGLEHRNSVCMMTNRWSTRTRKGYAGWLDLASHEFFHVWNIKLLRPVELGPFDYEKENLTKSLWVAEGITDYYGLLNVRRAGLTTRNEYLSGMTEADSAGGSLSALINTLQSTPGRLVQSAEQASYDAWIKLYRPDENSPNTTISYYTKGAVVAWLLDARIRVATHNEKSLDDLMRLAFERYSGARGFTPEEFKRTASEVAGVSLDTFFRHAVESTEELDYSEALEWFGLHFRPPPGVQKTWLGMDTKTENGRLLVTRVLRGGPAAEVGLSADDELIGIAGFRVRADQWNARLENYRPGDKVSLLIARREKLLSIDVTLAAEPLKQWRLEPRSDASGAQKKHLESWLGH